jgi:hypothetical protein
VEGMGKSSSNLSFEKLVEKLTIQTNNFPNTSKKFVAIDTSRKCRIET